MALELVSDVFRVENSVFCEDLLEVGIIVYTLLICSSMNCVVP